ncbi:hypothetical protein RHGRI_010602 [Rhododendron griersonianum]|uniref:BHLH domain-containing protein n=1 Tax=Rhododendron griersonianum TaxID=479676 RepID=A0AAV6KJ83_9ERIC|nr:hypothetical protein RHGRI_010602 [Rhododendron griersonianum]
MGKERNRVPPNDFACRVFCQHEKSGISGKGVGGEVGWNSPNRNHFCNERFAQLAIGIKNKEKSCKLDDTKTSMGSRDVKYSKLKSVEGMKLVFVELDQATSDPEGCATRKIVEDVDKLVSCLVNKLAEIFDSSLTGASSRSCEHVLNVVMQELITFTPMALSVYNSNWAPLQHPNFPPEITNAAAFPPQPALPELDMELLAFQDHLFYHPDDPCSTSIDPLFHYPANSDLNILPCLALPPPPQPPLDNSIPPQPFQCSYQYPKRQKCYEDDYYDYCYYPEEELMPSLKPDGFVANPPLLIPEFSLPSEIYGPVVPAFDYGGCGDQEASSGGGGGGSLSAQSIAARQRRRKITEKTQELGKLIPGGHKMNTAEMFHAASKYIKYLQAQVGILEFMGSAAHEESLLHTRQLQALASSPSIQEKLYSSDKCLVPKQFVGTLANYPDLHSNALISTELHQLMRSN